MRLLFFATFLVFGILLVGVVLRLRLQESRAKKNALEKPAPRPGDPRE